MSTTAIALSAVALAQSADANAKASEAARAACMTYTQQFTSASANIDEMRQYASCVGRLYPAASSGQDLLTLKVGLIIVLIGVVVGVYRTSRESYPDVEDYFLNGILGCLGGLGVAAVLGAIYFVVAA